MYLSDFPCFGMCDKRDILVEHFVVDVSVMVGYGHMCQDLVVFGMALANLLGESEPIQENTLAPCALKLQDMEHLDTWGERTDGDQPAYTDQPTINVFMY